MLSKVCKTRVVWKINIFFLEDGWLLSRYGGKGDILLCFFQWLVDVSGKEEKDQNSSSAAFLIVAPRVLLKIIVVFCSTASPQCVLPLLYSAFESCRK